MNCFLVTTRKPICRFALRQAGIGIGLREDERQRALIEGDLWLLLTAMMSQMKWWHVSNLESCSNGMEDVLYDVMFSCVAGGVCRVRHAPGAIFDLFLQSRPRPRCR